MNDSETRKPSNWLIAIAILELIVISAIIILDLFVPTLIILPIALVSLLAPKQGYRAIGFHKPGSWTLMLAYVFTAVVGWSLFHLSLTMPVLNHLTGEKQDLSAFEDLQGDLGALSVFLLLTWTLAAFGEEIVYRGYIQNRVVDIFGDTRDGWLAAVLISSILFGLAHTEQGIIGVVLTFLDAIFFCFLYHHFKRNLWASILAHGMSNSIGLITFYFTGPIYGFW
jgi:membrane protease YdiL (CAAX protease family)